MGGGAGLGIARIRHRLVHRPQPSGGVAASSASVIGGLFGARLLAVSVPILRPVMLSIGTPELLAIPRPYPVPQFS